MAANYTTSFNINVNDLQFILKQIQIAEASSAAYSAAPVSILQAIMDAYGATAEAAALLPAGLRTVDGTFNNLLIAPTGEPGTPGYNPGTSEFGAADTLFPRLTNPVFVNDADGDQMPLGPPGSGAPTITNTDYGNAGSVADADPRIISNLIVDMSVNNPAAIAAYLSNPLSLGQFEADHPGKNPVAPGGVVDALVDLEISNTDLQTIPNLSPDIGLSPGFNSWMTYFGQFFDHGLDLVTKGSNGTVYIPLQPDDPLYVVGSPTNFMALTRATVTLDANGVPQHENTTTSWIDQNQTYTSHASHQVFLREYKMTADGAVSTGRLIDGTVASGSSAGAIGNWGEVKAQAIEMLGLKLSDFDVHNAPLLATDQYGKFIPGANGFARVTVQVQLVDDATGAVASSGTPFFMEGVAGGLDLANLPLPADAPVPPAGFHYQAVTVGSNHAFLNDIAHHAAPGVVDHDHNPATPKVTQVADADIDANSNGVYDDGIDTLTDVNGDGFVTTADFAADDHNALTYDDEMLDAHFITGDGRGNENIALSAVHSIFHSEHNRAVETNKATLLANAADATLNSVEHANAVAFLNEWLVTDVDANSSAADIAALSPAGLAWDGDRLFQAARFSTEMQYQHMVFEEFARRIQPFVDPFIFTNTAEIDPSIVAEFAHTVYRFGHSMLTGTVDRLGNDLNPINGATEQETLLAVFLNPQAYTAGGADSATINADLVRGLSRDVGNAMDEFIVSNVRDSLVGLPLDLGALNIARGRDTGTPSLNETRAQLYDVTGLADLKPYENWADFAANIKNPASIINFIAAYGTHASITDQVADGLGGLRDKTVAEMRDAAALLVLGGAGAPADRFDFLGATGAYAGGDLGGMNNIDLWIGGLAEANPEFGGMLGTTFNYVFEYQMESLQNGDRMYYLSRTQGLNFLNQLEPNTFADMVMRNTELGDIYATHLNGLLFVTPDHFFELDRGIAQEDYDAGTGIDPLWAADEAHSLLTPLKVTRTYTGATVVDAETGITHDVGGTLKFFGGEHVVVGGTEGNDKIWTDKGIDTLWGDGGNDYLNAGTESDQVFGGEGDDIIEDPFGDDFLRGGQGNDVVSSARGFDVMFGEQGQDYIMLGQDASEVFAGQDDDFILGGAGTDGLLGNEGDDWIEGGDGLDGLSGENSQLFFDSTIIGHDVLNGQGNDTDYDGESGDDIMVEGAGIQRNNGMFGFDWAIHKNDLVAADSDLGIPFIPAQTAFTLRDRFDSVEGLSGWDKDDILTGAAVLKGAAGGTGTGPGNPVDESDLKSQNVSLIDGYAELLGTTQAAVDALAYNTSVIDITQGAEIIIGGGGSDTIQGNLGNDILDGDAWLNVRIKIVQGGITYSAESMSTDKLIMGQHAGKVFNTFADGSPNFASPAFGGASLNSLMLNGTINPGNLSIVREILQSETAGTDIDTAVYRGNFADYDVSVNADFSLTVAHTNPVVGGAGVDIDDGTDIIRNFEFLQFDDGTVSAAEFFNLTPVIAGGNAVAINVAENTPASTVVATVSATDGNNVVGNPLNPQTLTYSIDGGVDAARFSINATTGELRLLASPNREAPTDSNGNNTYNVIVAVSDGLATDTQAIVVTVTNVNEAPTITSNGGGVTATINVAENGAAVATVAAIDVDAGAVLAYSIVGGDDQTKFNINAVSGVLTFATLPDFEVPTDEGGNNVYDVVVQVSDGTLVDTQAVAVTVTDVEEAVNIAPVITSNGGDASASIAIDENIAAVTTVVATDANTGSLSIYDLPLTYSVSGADAALFAINATTGVLSFVGAPSFEAPRSNVYNVVVQVSDTLVTDTQELQVTVNNVQEAATGTATISSYTDNIAINTASYTASNTIADADGIVGVVTYQWQQLTAGGWVNISGATSATLANQVNTTVRATASATDTLGVTTTFISTETAITGSGPGLFGRNNTLAGTAGNDIMLGLVGNDTLNGGNGNDTLVGGTGSDALNGGAGIDTAVFTTALSGATFALSGANLQIITGPAFSSTDTLTGVEKAQFTDGTFNLNFGTNADNTLLATASPELFLGLGGVDTVSYANSAAGVTVNLGSNTSSAGDKYNSIENLTGSASADSLTGDANANVLTGGAGNDVLNGAGGNDTAAFSGVLANYGFSLDGSGNLVITDSRVGSPDGADTLLSIENLRFGAQSTGLIAGNNAVNAVNGGAGNDLLLGLNGNDTLAGGAGADILVGGADADTFDFNATTESGIGAAARDLIADFISGIDKLDFSTIDARIGGSGGGGNNVFTFNDVEGAAITDRGQLVYHYEGVGANEITVIQGNVNGNLNPDFEVALTGHIVFNQATDLVL